MDRALRNLSALPADSRAAAREATNETVDRLALAALTRTSAVYNVSARDLDPYVAVHKAAENETRATLTLRVRALPVTVFRPRVVMRAVQVRVGRSERTVARSLPHVEVAMLRGQAPKLLPGFFPLRQRETGQVRAGETVRKRIGKERGKLTGLRFMTFPPKFLQRLRPELMRQAADGVTLTFDAAFRKRGTLRRNR